jgi:hypothetical protein
VALGDRAAQIASHAMKRVFAALSLAICVAWLTLRALGWWRYAAAISGTLPEGASSVHASMDRATIVVAVHMAFVLFAAPLAATALALHALERRHTHTIKRRFD